MQIYYSKNTPPNSNFYLWNNSESDAYIMNFLTSGYTAEGIEAFKNWQYIQYIDVPASQIAFQQAVLTADSDLNFHGYQWIFDNIGPIPQYLTGMNDVVLATTGELLALNPMLSNSWYDTLVFNPSSTTSSGSMRTLHTSPICAQTLRYLKISAHTPTP
jgi:hypothetical protein